MRVSSPPCPHYSLHCVREVKFVAPGHGSVVEDTEGSWWFVYAVWRTGLLNTWPPGRLMMLDKISW